MAIAIESQQIENFEGFKTKLNANHGIDYSTTTRSQTNY